MLKTLIFKQGYRCRIFVVVVALTVTLGQEISSGAWCHSFQV